MSVRARFALITFLATIIVLAVGAYAYWRFLLQTPLAGELSHDFGEVALFQENEEVHHTFRLINRQGTAVTIVAVKPECGCLTTRDVNETLQPGEAFELPVTLIAKGGERVVPIRVVFDDDSMMMLKVRATGRYMPRLHMNPPAIALDDSGEAGFVVRLDTYGSWDEPQPPAIHTSNAHITTEFLGWQLKYRPKDVLMTPTHWEGVVRARGVSAHNESHDATITIEWDPAKPLTVGVHPPGTELHPLVPSLTTP